MGRHGRIPRAWVLAGVVLLHALPGLGEDPGLDYTVQFAGEADGGVVALLEGVSDTVSLRERRPATPALLQRRVERDVPRFQEALRSEGYYAADVAAGVNNDTAPVAVTFTVTPGPRYRFGAVVVRCTDHVRAPLLDLPEPGRLGVIPGAPARAPDVVSGERKLLEWMRQQGFPFPKATDRHVTVDHATQRMDVRYVVDPGQPAAFGPTAFTGLEEIEESLLRHQIPWKEGQPYDPRLLVELQNRLNRTGLFARTLVRPGTAVDEAGVLPITVEVTERAHRTFSAGVGYQSDEGPRGEVAWEHRNLFHHGEKLRLSAALSGIEYALEATLRKPDFRQPNQSLTIRLRAAHDRPEAYDSRSVLISATVSREISNRLTLSWGGGFRNAHMEERITDWMRRKESYDLLWLEGALTWRTADNTFDPDRGGTLSLRAAPYVDAVEVDFEFVKCTAAYTHYWKLTDTLVVAGRVMAGSLVGAGETRQSPPDERFYAGGGGSIRGYPYQSVSPLLWDDPIGGRSIFETSLELRWHWRPKIGWVVFLDGGAAFDAQWPNFSTPLRWAVGTGLRYFTPVGPLRFDIAFPINPPDNVDDAFQLYLSLGQAF